VWNRFASGKAGPRVVKILAPTSSPGSRLSFGERIGVLVGPRPLPKRLHRAATGGERLPHVFARNGARRGDALIRSEPQDLFLFAGKANERGPAEQRASIELDAIVDHRPIVTKDGIALEETIGHPTVMHCDPPPAQQLDR